MNFLAHLYLSGDNEDLMVGNLLGDFMRGRKISAFEDDIKKGIELHREIDKFTDNHPLVIKAKQRLRPLFKHYAPVVVDVYYDHFLAVNWKDYSDIPLKEFAKKSYLILKKHKELFPQRFQQALIYMRFRNLLISYAKLGGIDFAFARMAGRTNYPSNLQHVTEELERNYNVYLSEFREFFPELQSFIKDKGHL